VPLDRMNTAKQHNDRPCAIRGARELLKIILAPANEKYFDKVRGGKKLLNAAREMNELPDLTDKQLSFIDVIYEKLMDGAGHGSFTATYKPNPRTNLRFGGRK
jgi:hypothetical protein